MKLLDKKSVRFFEKQQKEFGTKVAMYNLLWTVVSELFTSIGVKEIKTK